jgi:Rieske 2Fe-2S family protein
MSTFLKATEIGTGGAMTLPGRYYTSPEVFANEQETIFLRHWLCVGREEMLPQAGNYAVRTLGTQSVIVVRDQSQQICAFHNVCRHRGTRICEASSGTFGRTIQCPYHAWTYGLDGQLIGAPSMDAACGFDKSDFPLHPAPLATWDGFIFLSLSKPPAPFEETFAPLIDRFAPYNLPQLRSVRRIDYDVRANWKLIFQNYSECYHCPTIHPALAKLTPSDSGANDLTSGPFLGGHMTILRKGGSMSASGRACAMPVGDLSPEDLQRVYYYSIFPNMLLSLHADYVMVHTLWPESPERTRIECDWLFHPDAAARDGFNPDDGVGFWDTTNRQDWHACELSQLGVASRAYTPGPYSPRESISAAFDRAYLQALAGRSAP